MARGVPIRASFGALGALLVLVLATIQADALSRNELYPYTTPGAASLQSQPDGMVRTAELMLQTPIKLYDKEYKSIFVNGNGVLSFIRPMNRFFNIPFPLDDPVVAPLYTHVDIRSSGTIFLAETNSSDVLARAGGLVRSSFKNAVNFVPTHVYLATWLDVGYFNEKKDKVNTYQVAISSNETHSYVELLYPEGGIQWIQGESHPNGLPDAKAQVGIMGEDKMYVLPGSGTDQIQNIDKWSNVHRPGQWVFQIGPVAEGQDIGHPDNVDDKRGKDQVQSCRSGGATHCHSKATCIDYEMGFCCACKQGYFGNGKSCQPNDVPLRVIGKVSGKINDHEFTDRDLQCYVQTKDGRTYTALARIPVNIGDRFQLLNPMSGVIGWLFAKTSGETKNGYQLTGGVFNHTIELIFKSTGDKVTIRNSYLGLDVFGQLKMESEIKGNLPPVEEGARIDFGDHEVLLTRVQPGTIRSNTERKYKLAANPSNEYLFSEDQVIYYNECSYAPPSDAGDDTSRLKFSRGITTYESREGIVRFAMNSKIVPLEEEDPCIQGRATCGYHSSCVADADSFRCVCDPGYQQLYKEDGSSSCVDINECNMGNHVCSPDAYCVNTEGSHTCHCRPGFSGDGRTCEKLASCDDTRCGDYEQCIMTSGTPVCTCIPGFENTPNGCYPITRTPCDQAHDCSPLATCDYSEDRQAHVCTCAAGYLGNGYECYPDTDAGIVEEETPIPKCHVEMCWCPVGWEFQNSMCIRDDEGLPDHGSGEIMHEPPCNVLNRCHPYAQCVHDQNSEQYMCQCNPGYEGDGMECSKSEISCLDVDICDPNASCRQDDPIAKCVCNTGYKGDGTTCSPYDECREHKECSENEWCSYVPAHSRFECTCQPGYSMVDGQCVLADCSTNPQQCHVNAQCVSSSDGLGGYHCACIAGYHGDGLRQCVEEHVSCSEVNNCGRNAVCGYNQTSANYACVCLPGFYGDGFNCVQQTSCRQNPSLCSRDASCLPLGGNEFTCVCNEGFIGDGADCRPRPKHEANFLLVNQGMATHRIPFFPTPESPGNPIYVAYHQMAIALDIDCPQGKAYASDITGNKIMRMTYNGSKSESFIGQVSSTEGIAIDWVSRAVFWTDSGNETIEVAHLDTKKRKILFSEGLINPRGIAVHPYRGKIFWSDWYRPAPKLECANEDGTGRQIFLTGEHVKLPNSLAIDWYTDELCWADAGTFTINCANIDNKSVRVIAKNLSYPFGLAISQNHYYWTDWKTGKIEVAVKSTGERGPSISLPAGGSGKPYGIVIVPETCPRASNICQYENGRCTEEQLCLPDGQGGRTCSCADNAVGPCTDSRYSK
ncbi:nidogen isoform X2 [Nasonia vitripennis]|uniref:Nidogen n=1 Tax=Nasonia vitripennis TaxID=7425 RepID=A0A7M7T892_NASVI|nr:nidogen isoform X2 [Nasonia vitripennis]